MDTLYECVFNFKSLKNLIGISALDNKNRSVNNYFQQFQLRVNA